MTQRLQNRLQKFVTILGWTARLAISWLLCSRMWYVAISDKPFTNRPIAQDLLRPASGDVRTDRIRHAHRGAGWRAFGRCRWHRHGTVLDHLIRVGTVAGFAIASFWLALMLQLLFAMQLRWLPLAGRGGSGALVGPTGLRTVDTLLCGDLAGCVDALAHLALPALALALPIMATLVRFARRHAGCSRWSELCVSARHGSSRANFAVALRAAACAGGGGDPSRSIVWCYVSGVGGDRNHLRLARCGQLSPTNRLLTRTIPRLWASYCGRVWRSSLSISSSTCC